MSEIISDEFQNIVLNHEEDLIFMTVKQYSFFLANGELGMESKAVYEHLMFSARLQQTNQVYATDSYLKKALPFGNAKIKKCKAWLIYNNFIKITDKRNVFIILGE